MEEEKASCSRGAGHCLPLIVPTFHKQTLITGVVSKGTDGTPSRAGRGDPRRNPAGHASTPWKCTKNDNGCTSKVTPRLAAPLGEP